MTRYADHLANQHEDNDYQPVMKVVLGVNKYIPCVRGKEVRDSDLAFLTYDEAVSYAKGWDRAKPHG